MTRFDSANDVSRRDTPTEPLGPTTERLREVNLADAEEYAAAIGLPMDQPRLQTLQQTLTTGKPRLEVIEDYTTKLDQSTVPTLIDQFLPLTGTSGVSGKTGTRKSFITLSMAYAVGMDIPWFGLEVIRRPVIVVSVEGSATDTPWRLEALRKHQDLHSQTEVAQWIKIANKRVNLHTDHKAVKELRDSRRARDAGFIILDTQSKLFPGLKENDATEANLVAAKLEYIADGEAQVLVVHHEGYEQTHIGGRGSSALPAALDSLLRVTKHGPVSQIEVELHRALPDQDGNGQPIKRAFEFVAVDDTPTLVPVATSKSTKDTLQAQVLAYLDEHETAGTDVLAAVLYDVVDRTTRNKARTVADRAISRYPEKYETNNPRSGEEKVFYRRVDTEPASSHGDTPEPI